LTGFNKTCTFHGAKARNTNTSNQKMTTKTVTNKTVAKFQPGRLVATPGALDEIPSDGIAIALKRHLNGDWGDVCADDWKANDQALKSDLRLLSVYHCRGVKFYIITECDRSVTTILLPEEY
jgi:hypothetical protein